MKVNTEIKSAEMTAAAKIDWIQEALDSGNYRTLQRQLKALRDAQMVRIEICLNASYKELKAQAERLIAALKPIAETQDVIEIVEQKIDKVRASLPEGTIANNSDFCSRVNTGTAQEKYWLVKKDSNGDGVTFIKGGGNIYHYCYAGDALRVIAQFGTPIMIERGVLYTNIRDFDLESFMQKAKKLGLKINLHPAMTTTSRSA